MQLICIGVCSGACGPDLEPIPLARLQEAITNGEPYSGHPSVGYLRIGTTQLCTATLVGQRTVITAAHCIVEGKPHTFYLGLDSYNSDKIVVHPQWNPDPKSLANDIAMIQLDRAPGIAPSVISRKAPTVGMTVTIIGFGITAEELTDADVKRIATNTIHELFDKRFNIAGTGGGIGNTCHGDSGGPAFADIEGDEVQVGVTSAGMGECGTLGYETRLDAYLDWLEVTSGGDLATGAGEDITSPAVTIIAPSSGDQVPLSFTLSATISDDVGVTAAELFIDDESSELVTRPPYWFTVAVSEGAHSITLYGRDQAGNQGEAKISVVADGTLPLQAGSFGAECQSNSQCYSHLCGRDEASGAHFCTNVCDPESSTCQGTSLCTLTEGGLSICGLPAGRPHLLNINVLYGGCRIGEPGAGATGESRAPLGVAPELVCLAAAEQSASLSHLSSGSPPQFRLAAPVQARRPSSGSPPQFRLAAPVQARRPSSGSPPQFRLAAPVQARRPSSGSPPQFRLAAPVQARRPSSGSPPQFRLAAPVQARRPSSGSPPQFRLAAPVQARRPSSGSPQRAPDAGMRRAVTELNSPFLVGQAIFLPP